MGPCLKPITKKSRVGREADFLEFLCSGSNPRCGLQFQWSGSWPVETGSCKSRVLGSDLGFVPLLDGNVKFWEVTAFASFWCKKYMNACLPYFLYLLGMWVNTFCITDMVSETYLDLGLICLSKWFSFCYFTVDLILYMRKICAVPARLLINLLNYSLSSPKNANKKRSYFKGHI